MKTILVPTDFSKNAQNALQYAAALAYQVSGKLIIAHIINLPVTPVESGIVFSPDAELEAEYKNELQKAAQALRLTYGFQLQIETVCQYGYFLANLNELVKTKAADLVVMGTRGATNFLDKLVGTNTSSFMKDAACPVLAIPAGAIFTGIKKIAYASDFESDEKVFLEQLFSLAEPLHAEVTVINILTERQLNIFSDNQVVRNITKEFPEKNYSIAQIQEKNVVRALQEFVADNHADVLAVSLHERSVLENLLHKSISKQLVYQAALPLLTLPEKSYRKPALQVKTIEYQDFTL